MGVITDDEWRAAKDFFPPQSSHKIFGRLPVSVRAVFESVVWLLKNAKPITQLPANDFPRQATVNRAMEKWMKDGTLVNALQAMGAQQLLAVAQKRFPVLRGMHREKKASLYKPLGKVGIAADAALSVGGTMSNEFKVKMNDARTKNNALPANKPEQYEKGKAEEQAPCGIESKTDNRVSKLVKLFGKNMQFRKLSKAEQTAAALAGGSAGGY
jgi:transposase